MPSRFRSRNRQSSAGSPSSVVMTLRSAPVTRRSGPTGWQPWVTRETSATSAPNATPDRPPVSTPSAMCSVRVRLEARPPKT